MNYITSDKKIQNIKNLLEKQHGREFTWEEATQAMASLQKLAEIASKIAIEEMRRNELLKKNPKGFHLDREGSCSICSNHVSGKNTWFDKYGLKCMLCQKAVNEKIIPGSVAKNKESWYSKHDLGSYFNIQNADLNKYIKQSILKVRTVQNEKGKVHLQLFLMKDNKTVLPPKKLLSSRIVKVIKNGEEYHTQEQWYEFADIKLIKRLQKYKIFGYLKETFANPVKKVSFFAKHVNPLFGPFPAQKN